MSGLRTVGVRLTADVSGYMANLRMAGGATKDFAGQLDVAARKGKLDAVADQSAKLGLGLLGVAAGATAMAARFDKEMSAVAAATHAPAREMDLLRAAALQAGKDTSFSATEAAQGIEELSKAGISTGDILRGGLNGALNLAAAGGLSVADAAETAASAMTQFKLSGRDVPHIADLLAAGAGKAQGSVQDMGMALKQGGLVAAQMGMSVEDTTGTLAAFASAGLMGSDAGTSLKTALLMLAKPTSQAQAVMEKYGISVYDTSGQFVGITNLAGQLQEKLGGLTQEQRNAALATIFGSDAIRSASVLYQNGATGIQSWIDKTNDAGYAAETAKKMTDNLSGDVERLTGSLETLAIQSGSGTNSGLRMLTKGADGLVSSLSGLPPIVGSSITVLAGVSGVLLLAGTGFVKVRKTSAEAMQQLRDIGPAGERAATGLGKVGSAAGKAAAAFAVLQVAEAVIGAFQKDLNPQIDAMGSGLENWAKGGVLAGESARVLGGNLSDLQVGFKYLADTDNTRRNVVRWGQDLLETVTPGLKGTNDSLARTRERVAAIDQVMSGMVQSGKTQEAAALFDQLAKTLAVNGVSVDELKAQFPQYAAALEVASSASGNAATDVAKLGGAAGDAATSVQALKTAFDDLFNPQMALDRANLQLQQGIISTTAALKQGKATLDESTAAGQSHVGAILDQIQHYKDLRQAQLDDGTAVATVDATYRGNLDTLRAQLKHLGFNKTAVDNLINSYYNIPKQASTDVTAKGAVKATGQVDDFNFAVRNVPPSKTVPFWASTAEAKAAVDALQAKINSLHGKDVTMHAAVYWTSKGDMHVPGGTLLKGAASGGPIEGKGQKGVDSEARLLAPGEHVLTAAEVDAMGGQSAVSAFRARLMSGSSIDSGSAPASVTTQPDPAAFARAVRSALMGVTVQLDGRTVGYLTGRDATLLART